MSSVKQFIATRVEAGTKVSLTCLRGVAHAATVTGKIALQALVFPIGCIATAPEDLKRTTHAVKRHVEDLAQRRRDAKRRRRLSAITKHFSEFEKLVMRLAQKSNLPKERADTIVDACRKSLFNDLLKIGEEALSITRGDIKQYKIRKKKLIKSCIRHIAIEKTRQKLEEKLSAVIDKKTQNIAYRDSLKQSASAALDILLDHEHARLVQPDYYLSARMKREIIKQLQHQFLALIDREVPAEQPATNVAPKTLELLRQLRGQVGRKITLRLPSRASPTPPPLPNDTEPK